jgi:DNA polymerase-4
MILHIDMDAFFASIEQVINPRFKGKPLIVGSRPNKLYTVVCAASYEAKRRGVHSGMSSADALKLCPDLEFVAADQSKYIWTSEEILKILELYGYPLEHVSIDEFQLDIGTHPEPLKLAENIRKQIYANLNITASVGIGKNWLLAKLASKVNKPDGSCMISAYNFKEVLSNTPLDKLCGMGGKTGAILAASGVKTCWDLYLKMPGYFDQNPSKFKETPEKPKSISHSYTLPRACNNPGVIRAWIRLLSEMVGMRLRQQNLVSTTVHLWLDGPEIGGFSHQRASRQATNDSFELYQRALKILANSGLKLPKLRALGVTASGLKEPEYLPFLAEEKRREGLIKAIDRINQRFGENTLHPAQIELISK